MKGEFLGVEAMKLEKRKGKEKYFKEKNSKLTRKNLEY